MVILLNASVTPRGLQVSERVTLRKFLLAGLTDFLPLRCFQKPVAETPQTVATGQVWERVICRRYLAVRFTHLYDCCSFSEWLRICWLQVRVMFCKYLGAWLMHFHHLFYYLRLLLASAEPTNLLPATGVRAGDVAQVTGGAAEAL